MVFSDEFWLKQLKQVPSPSFAHEAVHWIEVASFMWFGVAKTRAIRSEIMVVML